MSRQLSSSASLAFAGVFALTSACVVHQGTQTPTVASASQQTCASDAQCPGGSCQAGTCSPVLQASSGCTFDSDCLGGSCQLGSCSLTAPASTGCSFDSECLGGSCQMGSCSLTPSVMNSDDSSLGTSSLNSMSDDSSNGFGASSP